MGYWNTYDKECHWCGKNFRSKNPKAKYCPGGKCKQAHYRAYKKYVTAHVRTCSTNRNADKKRKKKKLLTKRRKPMK